MGGAFRIVATGDFDGDRRTDVIWNRPQGDMQFWRGDGSNFASRQYFAQYPVDWTLIGTEDIDGDGKSDLIWHRARDGLLAYWIMNGPQIIRHGSIAAGGSWRIIAVDDFNGDGKADLIWNRPQGDMQYWAGDGAKFCATAVLCHLSEGMEFADGGRRRWGWSSRFTLAQAHRRPLLAHWVMNGPIIVGHGAAAGLSYYQLEAGDYNGDGKLDLFTTSAPNSSTFALWTGDGASLVVAKLSPVIPGVIFWFLQTMHTRYREAAVFRNRKLGGALQARHISSEIKLDSRSDREQSLCWTPHRIRSPHPTSCIRTAAQ